jgi:two-component system nitrate/nitrite response regulator NarL
MLKLHGSSGGQALSGQLVEMRRTDPSPKTVGLVLRTPLIRAGLEHILSENGFDVLSGHQDPRAGQPDLIIVEVDRLLSETVDALDEVKARCPAAKVVVLADAFDLDDLPLLEKAGADGFCLTSMKPAALTMALEMVLLGEMFIPSEILHALIRANSSGPSPVQRSANESALARSSPIQRLSAREAEILRFLMQGATNKLIAKRLDLAEATVKVHVKAILRKIGASNRTQAALWANDHLTAEPDIGGVTGEVGREQD